LPWKSHRCWVWLVSLQPEQRAAVSQQSSLRTEYTTSRQVTSQSCVNKHITTIRGGTFVVDGVMVRAAAHSGGGTGRTGAVRSASMTSFKGTRKFRGKELDLDASIIEESRRCAREDVGFILSRAVDPARLGGPTPVREAGPAVDRHDVHKDPASSAASRWTLENIYSKPPDSVQEKLGGQPLVEL
jgi:hypothetical protein